MMNLPIEILSNILIRLPVKSTARFRNPCTNECKRVPNPPGASKDRDRVYVEYGFGYDYQIEDFKVVRLAESLKKTWCKAHVYTLKSNSWRRVDGVEMDDFDRNGMFDMARLPVFGSLHWIVYEEGSKFRNDHFILCFDIEKEEFDKMPLPILDDVVEPILCVLGGSLCLFSYDYEVISVWELKDSGVKKSWAKFFTIELQKHFEEVHNFIPLRSLKNGKFLLGLDLDGSNSLHMVIYDPVLDTVLDIHETSTASFRSVAVYVESLISLGAGTYLGTAQWEASHEEEEDESEEEDDEDEDDDDSTGDDETLNSDEWEDEDDDIVMELAELDFESLEINLATQNDEQGEPSSLPTQKRRKTRDSVAGAAGRERGQNSKRGRGNTTYTSQIRGRGNEWSDEEEDISMRGGDESDDDAF